MQQVRELIGDDRFSNSHMENLHVKTDLNLMKTFYLFGIINATSVKTNIQIRKYSLVT